MSTVNATESIFNDLSLSHEEAAKLTREKVKINELINFDKQPSAPVKVSVIVPVCNVEVYLRECLDSIVNQTLREIEIICVNDGSTDSSADILREYAMKDDRVKVIDKENAGYGHAMNIGMDMAQGEYIGIVESDDFIAKNMFSELYDLAKKNHLDIAKGDYCKIWGEGETRKSVYARLNSNNSCYNTVIDPANCMNIFQFNTTWSGIYKRAFLEKFGIRHLETPGASYQDVGFWFKTTSSASRIYYIDHQYYFYRQDNINSSIHSKGKVYFGSNEYKGIYKYLCHYPDLYEKFIGIFHVRKYYNFTYNLNRISDEFKYEFLHHFSDEFKEAFEKGEIDKSLFPAGDYQYLEEIVDDPDRYYKKLMAVPVVFSTDDNYAPYLGIAIQSLLDKADKSRNYYIAILADDISDKNCEKLLSLETENSVIEIKDVSSYVDSKLMYETRHYSRAMYYRILIPKIMSVYSKVLYLDCDILIRDDISKLYDIDLGKSVMGVAHNYCNTKVQKYVSEKLHISPDDYFNSGILLINCEEFTNKNIGTKCFDELKKHTDLNFPDQDILNVVCNGMVTYFDYRWNFQWHHLWGESCNMPIAEEYHDIYFSASEDPHIVHFTTAIKAWNSPNKMYSNEFWAYAKNSVFFNDIISMNFRPDNYRKELMGKTKISVIVPVYNMEKYLEYAVKSIQGQTLKEIQIVCVNDGSTDSSLDILNKLADDDNRILVVNQKNSGAGIARNTGIMHAKGDFIAFMDPDDFYPNNTVLETMYNTALKYNVQICGGSFSEFDGKKTTTDYHGVNSDNVFKADELIDYKDYQFDYGFHRFIYSADLIRLNNITFPYYRRFQDPPFFTKAMYTAGQFYALKQPTYTYRRQHKTISWNNEKVEALASGLRDDFKFSKENHLAKLHYITLCRINGEFKNIIGDNLKQGNLMLAKILFEFSSYIDNDLIREYKPDHKNVNMIAVLYSSMFGNSNIIQERDKAQAECKKVREEYNGLDRKLRRVARREQDAKKQLALTTKELTTAKEDLAAMSGSVSFRLGRFITWLPRMIVKLFKK